MIPVMMFPVDQPDVPDLLCCNSYVVAADTAFQERATLSRLTGEELSPVGVVGIKTSPGVVALTTNENDDVPPLFVALTRNSYVVSSVRPVAVWNVSVTPDPETNHCDEPDTLL